ncbi:MAG TPA: hypothetical protein VJL58_05425, partial [Pyrinomonadaceae bacterium]|nr:hypothetical protein [Pyrinomonadaceae bacterium]
MKGYITTISMLAVLLMSGTKLVSAGDGPPSNDIFANAVPMVIENGTASVITTNMEATKEPGEPNHAENSGGRSVWFKVTPVATTVLRINTTNNSFDTLLAVYTGDSVNNLTTVSFNDDCNNVCGFASTVDVMVTAGTTYYIAVDGYNDLGTPSAGTFKIA